MRVIIGLFGSPPGLTDRVGVGEVCPIEARLGPHAEASFLRLVTSDRFDIGDLVARDDERCLELVGVYDDLGLGFIDSSIIAVAERLGQAAVASLNHRGFAAVRPAHRDAFKPVP